MELEIPTVYRLFWLTVFAIVSWSGVMFLRKQRLPNVEFLRIVDKPGKAGDSEDVKAFMSDSLSSLLKGYNQVSLALSLMEIEQSPDISKSILSVEDIFC